MKSARQQARHFAMGSLLFLVIGAALMLLLGTKSVQILVLGCAAMTMGTVSGMGYFVVNALCDAIEGKDSATLNPEESQ